MKNLKNTKLWEVFASKATDQQRTDIFKCTEKAAQRLSLYRDTFPTYTLHNEIHVLNIINLMGELLGRRIDELTTLEAALLILSAYYHDAGMIFTEVERSNIESEPEFRKFLEQNPKAHIQLLEHGKEEVDGVPIDITEWYCRWVHADRCQYVLNNIPNIEWGVYPINDDLALICKSHGYSVAEIIKWDGLKIDMLGDTDLMFCAIILRLADILDFDNTRSPDEVYKYLGISNRQTRREEVSDIEWRKHLCTEGFKFNNWSSDERYILNFTAAPTEPAVEYDVREFLKVIEHELEQATIALKRVASEKWKDFKLPFAVNLDNIKSVGYTFGAFKFTLEQDQIMNLLMGENLYHDKYVFIRELAQNAIDATRHRVAYEKSKGNITFEPQPIEFSSWLDNDGYAWIRIDDYGMGMDQEILMNFFLKVGQSYYRSEKFKLDQLTLQQQGINFAPISRFGIGILSCFIVGDRLEVSTRRINDKLERNALRMSIENLQEFYILKEEKAGHQPHNMPNKNQIAERYRNVKAYGTSISVRINPKKEDISFDFRRKLEEYISCSPIPLHYEGEQIGGDYAKLVLTKWIDRPITTVVNNKIQRSIEDFIEYRFTGELQITITPLDITSNANVAELKGQAVLVELIIPEHGEKSVNTNIAEFSMGLSITSDYRYFPNELDDCIYITAEIKIPDSNEYDRLKRERKWFKYNYAPLTAYILSLRQHGVISHNGILLPLIFKSTGKLSSDVLEFKLPENTLLIPYISLTDNIRPNLSISRNEVKSMPWQFYSELELALRRTNNKSEFFTGDMLISGSVEFDVLDSDETLRNEWVKENLFNVSGDDISVNSVLTDDSISFPIIYNRYFMFDGLSELLKCEISFSRLSLDFLAQKYMRLEFNANLKKIIIIGRRDTPITETELTYPPLFFVPYSDNTLLQTHNCPLNAIHPFSIWLLHNTIELKKLHPGLINNIINSFATEHYTRNYKNRIISGVNKILDRLIELKYKTPPPKSIYLKDTDIIDT